MADTQLYDVLGISKNASDSEIKKNLIVVSEVLLYGHVEKMRDSCDVKDFNILCTAKLHEAYKKLAKEFHPDKNPVAGDRFKEISFAYEVLSDPQKKSIYDRYGLKALQESGGNSGHGFGGDIFSQLFGDVGFFGMPGMSFGGRYGRRKSEDTVHPLKVSLEDLYNGKVTELRMQKNILCTLCRGRGGKLGTVIMCLACEGRGFKVTFRKITEGISQQIQSRCTDCNGEGKFFKEKDRCIKCKGKKIIQETKILEVPIDKGMKENQRITFRGEGDQVSDVDPGDVIIVLQEKPHDVFQRSGNNLVMTRTISLTEALCGFQFILNHLDGRDLVITHPPGEVIQPDTVKTIENEGMPIHKNPFERGHLFIKFDIQFPESYFTDEANLRKLETLLPEREPVVIPQGENVEEVNMYDFDPNERSAGDSGRGEAYASDEDDHPNMGMQCAQQ